MLLTLLFFATVSADITRDELLNSDRLNVVSTEAIQSTSEAQTEQLKQQLLNVKDNQVISIASGRYANLGEITIAANNVTIKAETQGTAWLTGLVQLRVTGDNVVLDGLVFTEGGPAERFGGVRLMGDNNTATKNLRQSLIIWVYLHRHHGCIPKYVLRHSCVGFKVEL